MDDNKFRIEQEQSTQRRSRILGLNYFDTSELKDKKIFPGILTNQEMRDLRLVVLASDQSHNLFGITINTPQGAMKQLTDRFSDQVNSFVVISDTGFQEYMNLYDPPKQVVYQDINIASTTKTDQVEQISQILNQVRADDMLAYIVEQAHILNASDIHIETEEHDVRIRFRIDGVLHIIATLTYDKYRVLLSAIASAGNISISADSAQQGHIAQKITMADKSTIDVNVRLESIPTIHGIDLVMRLFNMDASRYSLDALGLSASERRVVDQIISKPTGLVMVVGPTGSGKTTTLYSILNTLNSTERKIITIEDPVEYQIGGISQVSVHSSEAGDDATFAAKLRAVLRLDPDILMVGEIRDSDTAKTALQAALTGHLVLTTFHASSASATLTRLSDMVGQNPLYASSIRLIMAQRLIRRLDDDLKQAYQPSPAELQLISKVVENLPASTEKPNLDNLQLYKAGKSETNPFGFKGQLAIREQLIITDNIRKLWNNSLNNSLTAQEVEKVAHQDGMITMIEDAILKVIAGQTTMAEVYRVIG